MFVVCLTENDERRGSGLLCSELLSGPRPVSLLQRPPGADPQLQVVSRLYSQADTLLILAVFSVQGCRFCRANRELFCRHSGSGVTGWLMVFWKASCCSCMRIRLACCRSASRSSAVCRLQRQQPHTHTYSLENPGNAFSAISGTWTERHTGFVFLQCPRFRLASPWTNPLKTKTTQRSTRFFFHFS